MASIVVIGGGGHAKVLMCVLSKSGYRIAGYTDREDRGLILGVSYLGDDSVLGRLRTSDPGCGAAIGVGKVDASEQRLKLQEVVERLSFQLPVVVSPQAVLNEETKLGAGTQVLDGVVVNSGAQIGRGCILNTNCTVEHDCRIGDNVHLAPGVTLSGGVTIGSHCLIGVGATVVQQVQICGGCLIGAGCVVVKDLSAPGTYVGNPAKRIR